MRNGAYVKCQTDFVVSFFSSTYIEELFSGIYCLLAFNTCFTGPQFLDSDIQSYLIIEFNIHINVKVLPAFQAVNHLYKYVTKRRFSLSSVLSLSKENISLRVHYFRFMFKQHRIFIFVRFPCISSLYWFCPQI